MSEEEHSDSREISMECRIVNVTAVVPVPSHMKVKASPMKGRHPQRACTRNAMIAAGVAVVKI